MIVSKRSWAILLLAWIAFPLASFARRPLPRAMRFVATADAVRGTTAKGTVTHRGVVAADPRVLPLGSLIRVKGVGAYSGTYAVTDTGSKVTGRKIDIFMPTAREAKRFGRRLVSVLILHRGNNRRNHREVS